jgi:hypothetical protein
MDAEGNYCLHNYPPKDPILTQLNTNHITKSVIILPFLYD